MESQMKVSEVQTFIEPHKSALHFVSSLYGVPIQRMESELLEYLERRECVITDRLSQTSDDETQAKLLSLAAILTAERYLHPPQNLPFNSPAHIAFRIEGLPSPILRDTLYSRYWLSRSIDEISHLQRSRPITVRQNLKRGMKQAFSSEKSVEEVLAGWRSRGAERDPCDVEERALVEALFTESVARELPLSAQEALVDAFSAAAREMATENILVIGPRSLRAEQGRAWIEPEKRQGAIARLGVRVSESMSGYDTARIYSISHPDQQWSVRLVHRPEFVEIVWQEGNAPLVVRGPHKEVLGVCGERGQCVVVPTQSAPFKISLRPTHQDH